MGTMHLQVEKTGQILGTAADVFDPNIIKGAVHKFRNGLWGTQSSLSKAATPNLHRQSQTLAKDVSKGKPWQLARKSAPQPSVSHSNSLAQDECRTSLARIRYTLQLLSVDHS